MGELSKRMMVTGGNVTGITDQLEQEGLVLRVQDPDDRRANSVRLTEAGRNAFAGMAAVHETWIAELLEHLSSAEKNQMIELLDRGLKGPRRCERPDMELVNDRRLERLGLKTLVSPFKQRVVDKA